MNNVYAYCESVDIPFLTRVPIYAMHSLSARATGSPGCWLMPFMPLIPLTLFMPVPYPKTGTQGSTHFRRATVSPVRLLSSISRSSAETSRTSAGMRSPVLKETRSPGTSSLARRWCCFPSLDSNELQLLIACHRKEVLRRTA